MTSLAPAFKEERDGLFHLRRFIGACGFLSCAIMVVLYWTQIRDSILHDWIGIDCGLAELCLIPLLLTPLFPLAVAVSTYWYGVALAAQRTRALIASGLMRIAAIVLVLLALIARDVKGGTAGIAALCIGFAVEALIAGWGVSRAIRGGSDV